MTYRINIDEHSLEQTAAALAVLNPGRSSAAHMRDMVLANMHDGSTSMGTAGWEATGFFPAWGDGTIMQVRFSVQAYTVNRWLEAHTCGT